MSNCRPSNPVNQNAVFIPPSGRAAMLGPGATSCSGRWMLTAAMPAPSHHRACVTSMQALLSRFLCLRQRQFAKAVDLRNKWLHAMPGIRSEADSNFRTSSSTQKSGMVPDLELERPSVTVKGRSPVKNGIYFLLLLNLGVYAADHWLQINIIKNLYLYHDFPRWYQFFTSTFCHANWAHLSSNLFFLYIFGKLVEEEEGSFALWISYLVTGAGANVVSWLLLPRSVVSVGASGAVFGLFAISVLVRLSLDWRKLLEVLILGQFVVERVIEAAQSSAIVGSNAHGAVANINHIAHLSGALVGVFLIWCISRLPSSDLAEKSKRK